MRVVHLPIDDIDTDQIIPARFLKGTTKTGRQNEPAVIVKFEGRHGCFPEKTEGTSEKGKVSDA